MTSTALTITWLNDCEYMNIIHLNGRLVNEDESDLCCIKLVVASHL